ncbi:hypothetical protein VQ574_20990 (plasmid) [Stutzerimonas frequens]|uniref:hypothetical protein n=1 Tax=Stutzerimonas frequens TaxID=2968969 RepID=UPI002DB8D529|nr:hypothetical protein [Stutzerimonas frequens]WRW29415.1 hypothetical protein VQ574_20990 [Stutzerimonas frequens]
MQFFAGITALLACLVLAFVAVVPWMSFFYVVIGIDHRLPSLVGTFAAWPWLAASVPAAVAMYAISRVMKVIQRKRA